MSSCAVSHLNIHRWPPFEVPQEEQPFNGVGHDGGDVLKLGRHRRNSEVVHQLEDGVESEEREHRHVLR